MMAETLIKHFFYAFIIMILIATAIGSIIGMVIEGTPGSQNDTSAIMSEEELTKFNRTFNKAVEIQSNLTTAKEKFTSIKPETTGIISTAIAFISSAWDTVSVIRSSIGLMDNVFKEMAALLLIPTWVATSLVLLVVVLFIFSIISLIFGSNL
ncbi:hypothetical protein A3C31_01280 [Candidatus Roizmanbacteria bacterium RIFCSPHIGHO2_02_FULL_40_53]|nr:MAG: hypothetical protein A3C31_01280 [Candidatus Roizmanbacteria bacterium RIFCSPHIGHO2_02_FULL_40_53]